MDLKQQFLEEDFQKHYIRLKHRVTFMDDKNTNNDAIFGIKNNYLEPCVNQVVHFISEDTVRNKPEIVAQLKNEN